MQNAGLMLSEVSYLSLFMFGISTFRQKNGMPFIACLLYTSDAADE